MDDIVYCKGVWKHSVVSIDGFINRVFFGYNEDTFYIDYMEGLAISYAKVNKSYHSIVSLRKMVIPKIVKTVISEIANVTRWTTMSRPLEELNGGYHYQVILTAFYEKLRNEQIKLVDNEFIARK